MLQMERFRIMTLSAQMMKSVAPLLGAILGLSSCSEKIADSSTAMAHETEAILKGVNELQLKSKPILGGDGVCYVGENLKMNDILRAFKLDEGALSMVPGALEWEALRRAEVDGWDIILTATVAKPGALPHGAMAAWKLELTNAEIVRSRQDGLGSP
jgi:hypothetical protein